jgi:hypothetical protein
MEHLTEPEKATFTTRPAAEQESPHSSDKGTSIKIGGLIAEQAGIFVHIDALPVPHSDKA